MNKSISMLKQWLLPLWLFSNLAFAATGPEVAQLLNNRYQNTTADCVGDHPAYFCSGVLMRGSPETGEFWKHSAIATQLGAESFSYLRADLGTRQLTQKNGVVFSDTFTAIGKFQTLDVLCAYPFTFAMTGTRPDFGCGSLAARAEPDPSSCAAQGVSDAQGWIAHFQQQGLQPDKQCSLSSQAPLLFKASLVAHQGLGGTWAASPNLLQIKNWDSNTPRQIPIQALFYDITQTGALLGAQKDQRDYFIATGDWLPILRMNLQQAPDGVFGFNQQDQLYTGYEVASRLNTRYEQTASTCQAGKTAYFCNGVLLRGTTASRAFHMWNPSPTSVGNGGVSFTYLRRDAGLTKPVYSQGFLVRESFAPAAYPLTAMCAYPFDGGTSRPLDTCRVRGDMCDELGITSVQAWATRYASAPRSSCAFNIDPAQFQLNIDVRPTVTNGDGWNEVMIQTWPQDIPLQIPLEAFYYSLKAHYNAKGLEQAQFAQRDYFEVTGRFLPIVLIDLEAPAGQVFGYNPADQLAPGAPAAN
ncbi:hypothetical protein A8L59_07220 [Pseudomonas koreensis]|uniref:Halovibrin HvnA n=1 Tax=Pseudomonas koreensis TaxID=198620 RepID=A0AAC9BS41_9PSED|nr:hypothetical protein [Pseudomonas koreensis]ANH97194.1 hypothetical protein A8L59_07220 [Pseudomonas koreensis]